MKYAILLYGNEAAYAALDADASKDLYADHEKFGTRFGDRLTGGAELKPSTTATTITRAGGEPLVTDGPYAETAEQLGGFYLVEARDLDEATTIAQAVPTIPGDVVEIRPLVEH
jgi:hypothetical protein